MMSPTNPINNDSTNYNKGPSSYPTAAQSASEVEAQKPPGDEESTASPASPPCSTLVNPTVNTEPTEPTTQAELMARYQSNGGSHWKKWRIGGFFFKYSQKKTEQRLLQRAQDESDGYWKEGASLKTVKEIPTLTARLTDKKSK